MMAHIKMRRVFLLSVCALMVSMHLVAQNLRLDLTQWGYKPPDSKRREYLSSLPLHTVSVGPGDEIAVGFVTRDLGLGTRELPPLTFHVLVFTREGAFVWHKEFPTASWFENGVYSGVDGNLVVRAGEKLVLFSSHFEQRAEKPIPRAPKSGYQNWIVFPLPNRDALLLHHLRYADS
jgi:hypothetical protein